MCVRACERACVCVCIRFPLSNFECFKGQLVSMETTTVDFLPWTGQPDDSMQFPVSFCMSPCHVKTPGFIFPASPKHPPSLHLSFTDTSAELNKKYWSAEQTYKNIINSSREKRSKWDALSKTNKTPPVTSYLLPSPPPHPHLHLPKLHQGWTCTSSIETNPECVGDNTRTSA